MIWFIILAVISSLVISGIVCYAKIFNPKSSIYQRISLFVIGSVFETMAYGVVIFLVENIPK